MRRAGLCVAVALGLVGMTAHAPAETAPPSETISLDEARAVARQALFAGRFELAREIAMGLLQADPEDAYAYGVLAAAHSRLNDPRLARTAARLSYRYSDTAQKKFGAARTAASIAYQQERPTVSQAWLRIAAAHADTPSQDKLLARDYGRVRAANPFSFNINLSVAPSDNVNNGTDNVLEVNNGIPTQGIFRNSSRALSGTVGTLDVRLKYRLRATDTSRTTATGRIYTRRVELSDSAEALAPTLSDGDFASTYVETGLSHQFALGKTGNSVTVTGALGASWYGGERNYDFAKIDVARGIRLTPNSYFSLRGGAEQRNSTVSDLRDTHVYTLGAQFSQKLDNGGRVNLGLTVQDVNGDFTNADFQTASLRASYTFGKQIGPAQITTGLTVGYTDYDQYQLVSAVDGGRQDTSVYGDVSLFFADYDFAGFAPTLRLRSGQRSSNVNRFEISETTISLGIQSKF